MAIGNSKKDKAHQQIRQAIIAGELKPGEILNIADLSEKYDLGITPVREALIVLESEGFLQSLPRTGYVITTVSVQDILETFHLRTVLEVEAIGLAAERITEQDIRLLEENRQKEIELAQKHENNHRLPAYQLNREFHLIIARAAGNTRMARLVEQFLDDMERMLAFDPYILDPQQHEEILEALRRGDKTAAQEAMRKHLSNTQVRIYDRF